jgi:hypothetical protein
MVYGSMFNVRQESHHIPFVRNLISAWVARQVDNKTKEAPVNTELEACPLLLYYIIIIWQGGGMHVNCHVKCYNWLTRGIMLLLKCYPPALSLSLNNRSHLTVISHCALISAVGPTTPNPSRSFTIAQYIRRAPKPMWNHSIFNLGFGPVLDNFLPLLGRF